MIAPVALEHFLCYIEMFAGRVRTEKTFRSHSASVFDPEVLTESRGLSYRKIYFLKAAVSAVIVLLVFIASTID